MFTICHFSDLHSKWVDLPAADLYICTGDMCPNSNGHYFDWDAEEHYQNQFIKYNPVTPHLTSPDAEVLCVRGNHDHVPIAGLFEGRKVKEIWRTDSYYPYENFILNRELTVGGMRGVNWIGGNGPDEMYPADLERQVSLIPVVDILLTHCAPYGILDDVLDVPPFGPAEKEHTGSKKLLEYVQKHQPLLHCFGHIHERKGIEMVGKTICSNAATGYNVIEIPLDI